MDYIFLEEQYFFIKEISSKLGTLHKVPIVNNKPHGLCYNNCKHYINENSNSTIINGYYIIMNMKSGVYEFLRHSVIKDNKLFDITYPGADIDYLYFIETDKNFYDLEIKMFYLDDFTTDYTLLDNKGKYYVYGLFDKSKSSPFYIGKGKNNRAYKHLLESNLNKDTNKHKVNTIRKIGPENVIIKKKYVDLLDESFAYDLEELTIQKIGLDKLTNICLNANPPNMKGKTYEEIMGKEKADELIERKRQLQIDAGGWGPDHHTKETKAKMSVSQQNRLPPTQETLDKMSKSMMGKNVGKTYSDEVNAKKGSPGELNGMYGKKHIQYKCKYCDKEVALHLLNRWHNENCNFKGK